MELFQRVTQETNAQARQMYEKALELDPTYAAAYAALGRTYHVEWIWQWSGVAEKAMRFDPRNRELYLLEVGFAYGLMGRYEEAITALKRVLTRYPNHVGAHVSLAVSYSELGREEEAQAEAAEVLRISPNFSLESVRQRVPFKDPAVLERALAALRKAGLK